MVDGDQVIKVYLGTHLYPEVIITRLVQVPEKRNMNLRKYIITLPSGSMAHHIPVRLLYHGVLMDTVSVFLCVFCATWCVIAHLHVRQAKG